MSKLKRIISLIVTTFMLLNVIPYNIVFGATGNTYSVNNGYMIYKVNTKTGGFSVNTLKGNPQKNYDNYKNLLFDSSNKNVTETSFTTVRIDGEDYIFGQDYGLFGLESKFTEPIVNNTDKTIVTSWELKGVKVEQKIQIASDPENELCGNVGIGYNVTNTDKNSHDVAIRVLLDSSLGTIDAPYMISGFDTTPTYTETKYNKESMPNQIRSVNNVASQSIVAYTILKGWNGGVEPDEAIIGHWANLATNLYDYTPDSSCNFNDTTNSYKVADSALALYWDDELLLANATKSAEFLYGIGEFSQLDSSDNVGISVTSENVTVANDKKSYNNNGEFDVVINIDNAVSGSKLITSSTLQLAFDNGITIAESSENKETVNVGSIPVGQTKTYKFTLKASPQYYLSGKEIVASLHRADGVTVAKSKSIILPSVKGNLPEVRFGKITPEKYYFKGTKNINISGKFKELKALKSYSSGWNVYLQNVKNNIKTTIPNKNVTFVDDATLALSLNSTMDVGKYKIVFEFTDNNLINQFSKQIQVPQELEISKDKNLVAKSYGILAIVRYEKTKYKIQTFSSEDALANFRKNEKLNVEDNTLDKEILLEVRGNITEFYEDNKLSYYYADASEGNVTINNLLSYTSEEALIIKPEMKTTKDGEENASEITVSGNGKVNVIGGLTFLNSKFELSVTRGLIYTLNSEKYGEEDDEGESAKTTRDVKLENKGLKLNIQNLAGFTVELKDAILSESFEFNKTTKQNESEGFGVNFGGKMALTFLKSDDSDGDKKDDKKDEDKKDDDDDDDNDFETAVKIDVDKVLFNATDDGVKFKGIDAKAKIGLSADTLGGFIETAPGVFAEVQINTIENIYQVKAGVKAVVVECQGLVKVKIIDAYDTKFPVIDALELSIASDAGIYIVPGVLKITKISGGYSGLGDAVDVLAGNKKGLPDTSIKAGIGLDVIEVFKGECEMELGLTGLSIAGKISLAKIPNVKFDGKFTAKWTDPFKITFAANVTIFDVIKGGVSLTFMKNYFYGYGYCKVIIPKKIWLIGGKTLASVEVAVSSDFIGCNGKVLLTKFGVIYYWGDSKASFKVNKHYDLSGRSVLMSENGEVGYGSPSQDCVAMYGTNIFKLDSKYVSSNLDNLGLFRATPVSSVTKNFDPSSSDAIIIAIPYESETEPTVDNIVVTNPNGKSLSLTVDKSLEGGEEGNFLLQEIEDEGKYIFVSVIDKNDLVSGDWTVATTSEDITFTDYEVNEVESLPEVENIAFTKQDDTSKDVNVTWTLQCEENAQDANVDIFITKDKNSLENLKNDKITDDTMGVNVGSFSATDKQATITLPETFDSGEYYIVASLSSLKGAASSVITTNAFTFKNSNEPNLPQTVSLENIGDGKLKVNITDNQEPDYTHLNINVLDGNGEIVKDACVYAKQGSQVVLGDYGYDLPQGKDYKVEIQSVKEEPVYEEVDGQQVQSGTKKYLSSKVVTSSYVTLNQATNPKLVSLENNVTDGYLTENSLKATYTFDQDVKLNIYVNGVSKLTGDEYKSVWDFSDELEDGEYTVTIKATNANGDKLKASVKDIQEADVPPIFTCTIDTQKPILNISSKEVNGVQVSNQTLKVVDGKFELTGLTEANATLTLDDSSEGVTVDKNGNFTISRSIDMENKESKELLLVAKDKALNESSVTVFLINDDIKPIEEVKIKLVQDEVSTELEQNDDVKVLSLDKDTKVQVEAVGVFTLDGTTKEVNIDDDLIWSVDAGDTYGSFTDGELSATEDGQMVISAKYLAGVFTMEDGSVVNNYLSDSVLVTIGDVDNPSDPSDPSNPSNPSDSDDSDDSSSSSTSSTSTDTTSDKTNTTDKTSSQINEKLNKLLDEFKQNIGSENVQKVIDLSPMRQESVVVNDKLSIIVPVSSFSKNNKLVVYKDKESESLISKNVNDKFVSDVLSINTVEDDKLSKPLILYFDYSKLNITDSSKLSLYSYNKYFDKWEYVKTTNNTKDSKLESQVTDLSKQYAFIEKSDSKVFDDVNNHWSQEFAYRLASLGIIDGVNKDDKFEFLPDNKLTRAELLKMAVATKNIDVAKYESTVLPFEDADKIAAWSLPYVKAAYANGWISGKEINGKIYSDTTTEISRQDTVVILNRIQNVEAKQSNQVFNDENKVSSYAKDAVDKFYANNIISGYENNFNPVSDISRGEAATIVIKWIENALNK